MTTWWIDSVANRLMMLLLLLLLPMLFLDYKGQSTVCMKSCWTYKHKNRNYEKRVFFCQFLSNTWNMLQKISPPLHEFCLHDIALGDTLSNKIKCFFAKNDTIQYSFQYFYPKFISKYHTIQYKLWWFNSKLNSMHNKIW